MAKGVTKYIFTGEGTLFDAQNKELFPSALHLLKTLKEKGTQVYFFDEKGKIAGQMTLERLGVRSYFCKTFDKARLKEFFLEHRSDAIMVSSNAKALKIAKSEGVLTCAIKGGSEVNASCVTSDISCITDDASCTTGDASCDAGDALGFKGNAICAKDKTPYVTDNTLCDAGNILYNTSDALFVTNGTPYGKSDANCVMGDIPCATSDAHYTTGNIPCVTTDVPCAMEYVSCVTGDLNLHAAPEIEKYIDAFMAYGASVAKNLATKDALPIAQNETIDFIKRIICKRKIERILELGSAAGYSAIQMAKCPTVKKVLTIEKDKEKVALAKENFKREGVTKKVTIIAADALTFELECKSAEDKFDLIFIDCAKSKYKEAFERYSPFLRAGGVIISDNLSFHGMVEDISLTKNRDTKRLVKKIRDYRAFLAQSDDWKTQFFELGDGVGVTEKKGAQED